MLYVWSMCDYGGEDPTLLPSAEWSSRASCWKQSSLSFPKWLSFAFCLQSSKFWAFLPSVLSFWNAIPSCDLWLKCFSCSDQSKVSSWRVRSANISLKYDDSCWLISIAQHSALCVVFFAQVINFWLLGLGLYQSPSLCGALSWAQNTLSLPGQAKGEGRRRRHWETIGKKVTFLMGAEAQFFQGLNQLLGKVGRFHRGAGLFCQPLRQQRG